jgi:hypothetical protein
MLTARSLTLVSALVLAAPAVRLDAQVPRGPSTSTYAQTAYNEGYRRGERVGEDHGRRGAAFNFSIDVDYRRGDVGWSAQFGSRDRYRQDFRVGFEAGYRSGYERFRGNRGFGPPVSPRGRAFGRGEYGYGVNTRDVALNNGFNDGYEEGLNDGRKRHRDDPIAESRYRNADRGYDRWYGPRDAYRANYRRAFIEGYETGYRDGWSYR